MNRFRPVVLATCLALTWQAGSVRAQSGQPPAPPRPAAGETVTMEVRCRQVVEQKHAPGTLSRNRHERQRLIDACIANGGTLP